MCRTQVFKWHVKCTNCCDQLYYSKNKYYKSHKGIFWPLCIRYWIKTCEWSVFHWLLSKATSSVVSPCILYSLCQFLLFQTKHSGYYCLSDSKSHRIFLLYCTCSRTSATHVDNVNMPRTGWIAHLGAMKFHTPTHTHCACVWACELFGDTREVFLG